MKNTLLACAFLLTSSLAMAQMDPAPEDMDESYFDFAALTAIYGEPRVMINLSPGLLQLMAVASREEPDAAQLMSSLDGVRVNVYTTGGATGPAMTQVSAVQKELAAKNWEPVVQVKEPDEMVQIFMKTRDNDIQGLVVMAVDDEEAVFLNIRGNINPAELGTVMKQLDMDAIDIGEGE